MICKIKQLEVGDVFLFQGRNWNIIQIDDEVFGRELHLQDSFGEKRSKFFTHEELATIDL